MDILKKYFNPKQCLDKYFNQSFKNEFQQVSKKN